MGLGGRLGFLWFAFPPLLCLLLWGSRFPLRVFPVRCGLRGLLGGTPRVALVKQTVLNLACFSFSHFRFSYFQMLFQCFFSVLGRNRFKVQTQDRRNQVSEAQVIRLETSNSQTIVSVLSIQNFQLSSSDHCTSHLQFQLFTCWYLTLPPWFHFHIQLVFKPIHGHLGRGPISFGLGGHTWRLCSLNKLESIGSTLLQLVSLCNFPIPMKALFDWGNILCHLQDTTSSWDSRQHYNLDVVRSGVSNIDTGSKTAAFTFAIWNADTHFEYFVHFECPHLQLAWIQHAFRCHSCTTASGCGGTTTNIEVVDIHHVVYFDWLTTN